MSNIFGVLVLSKRAKFYPKPKGLGFHFGNSRKLTKAHHAYCQAPRLSYQRTQSELTHPRPPGLRRTGGSAAVFSQVKGLQCSATTGGLLQSVSSAPLRSTLGTALGFRSAQAKEADDNG